MTISIYNGAYKAGSHELIYSDKIVARLKKDEGLLNAVKE